MLSKSDLNKIREIIREELKEAFTIEMTMEKKRDEKTGQPLAVPEIKKIKVWLPEDWPAHFVILEMIRLPMVLWTL